MTEEPQPIQAERSALADTLLMALGIAASFLLSDYLFTEHGRAEAFSREKIQSALVAGLVAAAIGWFTSRGKTKTGVTEAWARWSEELPGLIVAIVTLKAASLIWPSFRWPDRTLLFVVYFGVRALPKMKLPRVSIAMRLAIIILVNLAAGLAGRRPEIDSWLFAYVGARSSTLALVISAFVILQAMAAKGGDLADNTPTSDSSAIGA